MNSINYQKEQDIIVNRIISDGNDRPKLLLHSCCAPCSSYCLVSLREWFDITCLYYNPNITDVDEYNMRVKELYRLADLLNNDPVTIVRDKNGNSILSDGDRNLLDSFGEIKVINGEYEPDLFLERVRSNNLALEPEGGKRCSMCFDMRLRKAAEVAKRYDFDYFTTSLTISPLKNATVLNELGMLIAKESECAVKWLPSDFKKRNGYKLSVELSNRYGMYRQNYCGCVYSMATGNR